MTLTVTREDRRALREVIQRMIHQQDRGECIMVCQVVLAIADRLEIQGGADVAAELRWAVCRLRPDGGPYDCENDGGSNA